MTVAIKVPSFGESITEGMLAQWFKQDGDFVDENEPLFELETDKASQDIPAPASGVLHIGVSEGETVAIGDEVGRIDPKEEGQKDTTDKRKTPEKKEEPSEKKEVKEEPKRKPAKKEFDEEMTFDGEVEDREPVSEESPDMTALSPAVRRIVEEEDIDIEQVRGTGRDGRVTKEDVLHYLDKQRPAPSPDEKQKTKEEAEEAEATSVQAEKEAEHVTPAAPIEIGPEQEEQRRRMSPIRQRIAENLVLSQQSTATLTTFNEADMSAVLALRSRYKEAFREKHGVNLGFMSFFVKACVEAINKFPQVNGHIEGNEIVTYNYCNIGIAVSTEKGLMVPVIRDTGNKTFAQIEKKVVELADKARDKKITPDDLQGGTFTITNGGVFGSLLSTPILVPGQSAILGMHTIQKRPVVVDDQVVVRSMMYLALSYDHRLIDGREAVQFLMRVKECIENPERLLLEV